MAGTAAEPLPVLSAEMIRFAAEHRATVIIGYPFWLRVFLLSGVVAITLGRRIYVSPRVAARSADAVERLIRHELAHVRQWSRLGLFRFAIRYLGDYLRLRRSGLAAQAAYRAIPFEVEAREAEVAPLLSFKTGNPD
ncbi:MAG: DUF4157 domain-containing protein [Acidobacteriota bacterium]